MARSSPSTHDQSSLPTPAQLTRAASLPVIAASGLRVPFASLFAARPTIVVFTRHFWCPHSQDYLSTLARTAPRPCDLVVIGNGAPAFIPKYRALCGLEFEVYTDPTLAVYAELGMVRCSASAVGGIAKVVLRTLKAGLPVWERGGDIHQLGGEFVFGPGLTCTYAHRMQSPKDHAPIHAVLSAAGIDVPASPPPPTTITTTTATTTTTASPPKLLASLRIKSWTPQKRSKSLGTTTPNASQSKTEPGRRKNRNTTHVLATARTASPGPMQSPSPSTSTRTSPITEFGAWRRAGRVSFDSSRVLSATARSPSFPYTTQHRHRAHASTGALPLCASVCAGAWGVDSSTREAQAQGEGEEAQGEEEEAWSPRSLLPPGEDDDDNGGDAWMRARMASLEAIKARKRERRAGVVCVPRVDCPSPSPRPRPGPRASSPASASASPERTRRRGRGTRTGSPRAGVGVGVAWEPLDEAAETEEESQSERS
ncbi:hypothetical protein C0992_000632 [Termitomyces sp. T32_za158]|nr:hypothetical protein C0992_000632 [Termitomyces sp. T32_za158]